MNTSTPLEDQLRSTLQHRAGQSAPHADAADVRRRVQRRRRRRQVIPAVAAVAVIATGIVVTRRQDEGDRTSTAAEAPGDVQFTPRADGPAYVTLPGWDVTRYQEMEIDATLDHVTQARVAGDARLAQIQVVRSESTFALGSAERPVDINGARGGVADAGGHVILIVWEIEGGTALVAAERMSEEDALLIARGVTIDDLMRVTGVDAVPEGMTVEFLPLVAGTLQDAEYQWSRVDQHMQLHLYDGGQAVYDLRIGGDVRQDVTVFGSPASLLDYGTGRFRVDVLVGEHTFEFDGEQFASIDDFLSTVEGLQATATAPPAEVTAERFVATQGADGSPTAGTAVPPNAVAEAETSATTVPAGK